MIGSLKKLFKRPRPFSSRDYWETRYSKGGNSGSGSYGDLAKFKAAIINDFVEKNAVQSVIEFGCGDGNQLKLAKYPRYIGLDVSPTVIQQCGQLFSTDNSKSFFRYDSTTFFDNARILKCELAMSLDVLYHLVEDEVYYSYLRHLFGSGGKFVIIYSSNDNIPKRSTAPHERHRKFTDDVQRLFSDWMLTETVENSYKPKDWADESGSSANFYIFSKADLRR
jgi:SAM-dependent methyltransferase